MHPFFKWIGFPIRKSADQFIFADPRSLSQLITSFIASESQGIPRVPFLTFFYHCRLLLGTVCFFYSGCRLLVHWFISSLVLIPLYLCRSNPLKPTTVLSVVFSLFYFFQYVKERFGRRSFSEGGLPLSLLLWLTFPSFASFEASAGDGGE